MRKGFTLLEVMIIVVILTLVVSIIMSSFISLNNRQALDGSAEVVKAVLERAQSLTLSSQNASQYGVHFASSSVVLFAGSAYSVSSPTNATTSLNTKVTISSVTLNGGGVDVVFNRLTGNTGNYGTTTLSLLNSSTTQRQLIISPTGSIQYE